MFTEALLVTAPNQKPKCPSNGKMVQLWYITL